MSFSDMGNASVRTCTSLGNQKQLALAHKSEAFLAAPAVVLAAVLSCVSLKPRHYSYASEEQSCRLGCMEAVGAMDDTSFSSCSGEREGLELHCFLSFILLICAVGR